MRPTISLHPSISFGYLIIASILTAASFVECENTDSCLRQCQDTQEYYASFLSSPGLLTYFYDSCVRRCRWSHSSSQGSNGLPVAGGSAITSSSASSQTQQPQQTNQQVQQPQVVYQPPLTVINQNPTYTQPALPANTGSQSQPTYGWPSQQNPVYQPPPVQTQPAQPVQTQPVQTQPVQTQPVQTQPVYYWGNQPTNTNTANPVYQTPVQQTPTFQQPANTNPVYVQPVQASAPNQVNPVYQIPSQPQPPQPAQPLPQPMPVQPPAQPGGQACGVQTRSLYRVIGGTKAQECEFPWVVGVLIKNLWCGGSILDKRHILTAAHCMKDRNTQAPYLATDITVTAGSSAVYLQSRHKVARIDVNPRHVPRINDYDVAVLTLTADLVFSDCITPLCLPAAGESPFDADYCQAAGWGITENGQKFPPQDLMKVTLPLVTQRQCTDVYTSQLINSLKMCAGNLAFGGVDTCKGDSGGPLMCFSRGKFTAFGIVSFGGVCGAANRPGVYTNVSNREILDYIYSVIRV